MSAQSTLDRFDEKKIDAIFAPLDQCHKPGAAVAIAIGGVPVYRKGFGLASIELPALLTTTMRMRIGSTTKHFACLAFMLLCEDGKAGIDDPIEKHIPEIHAVAHGATMRQIMGHTSGLRDLLSITLLTNGLGAPVTEEQMVSYYETIDDVDFAPGTAWSYNNGGYQLLTAVIERVAGEPLDDVLRKRIFQPAGMYDTMLRRWDRDFVPNSATLHMIDGKGGYIRDTMGMEMTAPGGVVSTMDDMLVWLKHMDAPTVGTAETWALMREPHRLSNGQSTGYGLGLMTVPYRGVETITHGGTVVGGNSQMIKVPFAGLDISIALNRSDANAAVLANQVIDLLVEGLEALPDSAHAEAKSGLYVSRTSKRVVELTVQDNKQLFSLDGSQGTPVTPDEDGVLQLPAIMQFLQTTFTPGVETGRLAEFGNAEELEKVEPNREAKLSGYVGIYRSEPLGAVAKVIDCDGNGQLAIEGRHGGAIFNLTPLTDTIWRASGVGALALIAGIVTFNMGGLDISFTRMKHMRFSRA
jgi:CubicO group peptidase (beta-lactamase class C family)